MTTKSTSTITLGLRAVAMLQGVAIVVLAMLLLGADDVAPAHASPGPTPPQPVAAAAAQAAPAAPTAPDREEVATAATAGTVPVAAAATGAGPGTVLYGRVVGEAGESITEGVVWFSGPEGKQLATVSLSQRDSCFAIAGLTPGEVAFRTRVTGYLEKSETIPIPDGTPRLRHDIVLAQAWVLVVKILTPDGKPLHVALQEVSKERPMLRHVQASAIATAAQPDGDFPLTALREVDFGLGRWRSATGFEAMRGGAQQPKDVAGVLELDGKQRVWVSAVLRHRVLTSVAVEPGQAEVTLTVGVDRVLQDLGTIRGRVVNGKTGEPVPGAAIGFGDLQSSGNASKADGEGRFEVRNLRPGLLDVEIQGERLRAPRDLIVVQPGQVLDLGDVPVFEYRTIKGRCEGVVGKAESLGVSYRLLDPPSHPALRRHTDSARVAADGTFTLYLAEGRYRLRASGAGGALTEIDTRTLGDEPLVLQLAKESSLRLDVQTNGAPMELAVFDAAGREVYRRDLRHGWKFPLRFLPGDYRIELKDGSGRIDTRRITLGDAGADLRVP